MIKLILLLIPFPQFLFAQFIYDPLATGKFENLEKLNITACIVYKVEAGEKVLVKKAEFSIPGLKTAYYEYGTNEAGDSITTVTALYTYDHLSRLIFIDDVDVEYGNSKTLFTYDNEGRLVTKQIATIDPPTYTYHYNSKNQLTGFTIEQEYPEVDENGEWTQRSFKKPTYKSEFIYNVMGLRSEELIYGLNDSIPVLQNKLTWQYDEQDRVINFKTMDGEGNIWKETIYKYDPRGLLIQSIEKDEFLGEEVVYGYEWIY